MGYFVETYEREELHRLAVPGQRVSTLFWVLPLGAWEHSELQDWWSHFTSGNGVCHELGLLLVRNLDNQPSRGPEQSVNLSKSLAAADNLMNLIPEAERNAHLGDFGWREPRRGYRSLLFLSGAYPQPGWALHVKIEDVRFRSSHAPAAVENIILHAIEQLPLEKLEAIKRAGRLFRDRDELRSQRPYSILDHHQADLDNLRGVKDALTKIDCLVDKGTGNQLEQALDQCRSLFTKLVKDHEHPTNDDWDSVSRVIRYIKRFSPPHVEDYQALSQFWSHYESIPSESRPSFLSSMTRKDAAKIQGINELSRDFADFRIECIELFFRENLRTHLREAISQRLGHTKTLIEGRFVELSGMIENRRSELKIREDDWRIRMRTSESRYREALESVTASQWDLAPKFLMALEKSFNANHGFLAQSVAWDPVRMVGWKLHESCPGYTLEDLKTAKNTLLPRDPNRDDDNGHHDHQFSGSLFADYAYFVSVSSERTSPYDATKKLLDDLLGTNDLRSLLGIDRTGRRTRNDLIDELLGKWGWKKPLERASTPLLRCVEESEGTLSFNRELNGVRILLESFMKDLLQTTFANLRWNDSQIPEEISIHCQGYRPDGGRPRTWEQQKHTITIGPAWFLLKCFLPMAFPTSCDATTLEQLDRLLVGPDGLPKFLNQDSHNQTFLRVATSEEINERCKQIQELVSIVTRVVGEMPWHLRPDQSFGSDPTVITGHAWSHSHREERIIRVLLSDSNHSSDEMLVWNPSRTNPVMTEARII